MSQERTTALQARRLERFTAPDRVQSIIAAAEEAAEQLRDEAEERLNARIAEGERAASYRVAAAEDEAREILELARAEAERLTRAAHEQAEQERTTATGEALSVVAKATEEAQTLITEATEAAERNRHEAEEYTRELLSDARFTAMTVRDEGLELVTNLRQMGDSLRANAERLLRDVQSVHSHMVARIDRAEGNGKLPLQPRAGSGEPARSGTRRTLDAAPDQGDLPDVPEFIPRR